MYVFKSELFEHQERPVCTDLLSITSAVQLVIKKMDTSIKVLVFLSTIFIIFDGTSAVPKVNVTTIGICEIEVPTVSILPPELKHTAASIRGNGTTPGYTKIKICCAGYSVAPRTPFHCVPDCPKGCGLGNCTAPNVCVCHKDAVMGLEGKCIASCPKSCLNGQCYGSLCNCNYGYTLEPKGKYCIAGCTRNCGPGGQCFGNNQCKCSPGYQLNQQGSCQVFCDTGYKLVGNVCEPQCTRGCVNGICVGPDRCSCNPGYTAQSNGTCTPNCSQPCYNGFCSGPNQCSCKQGYIKDATDAKGNRCVPYCAQGCPNGVCSAPNFCICKQGYIKQSKGSNVCIKK